MRGKDSSELYQTFGARSSMVFHLFNAEERNAEQYIKYLRRCARYCSVNNCGLSEFLRMNWQHTEERESAG